MKNRHWRWLALVLATPESQWPYHDTVEQITCAREYCGFIVGPDKAYKTGEVCLPPLGDILLVMRVGGRHMKWNEPVSEVAAAQ